MRAEEQLKLAYMTIAELKDQNAKLIDAVAALERRLAESDGRDRRMVEEFYKGMIEDMRAAQEKTRASYEGQLSDLRKTISELTAQISALALSSKVNAGKLYGRKSEKSSRLGKRRDDDDRNSGKDNFDGAAGSDSGANTEVPRNNPSSGDTVSAIQKRLLRTLDTITVDRPIAGCCFGTDTLSYILMEKFWYNTPFEQIVRKLRALGLRMSKSTLGDNIHRAIEYMRGKMKEYWERAMFTAGYWMTDETPGLVGCEDADGNRVYRKKYFWSITAKVLKLSWLFYEEGSRGAKAIKPYLEKFIGFYTTDGYVCYKVFDMTDEELAKLESPPHGGVKKRSACLVHIRRLFVNALEENYDEAMWFIDRIGMVFAKEHCFKEQNMTSAERYVARLKPGSTADLMRSIEDRLADYALSDDAGCGELLKKAMRYARAEWPAMKRVLESGDVEVSNNISEQSVRKLKMNLRNAGNIGSESSAVDNAFMYSVIESCKHNEIDPGKYISYLLGKLKTAHEGEDLTALLPCYCSL